MHVKSQYDVGAKPDTQYVDWLMAKNARLTVTAGRPAQSGGRHWPLAPGKDSSGASARPHPIQARDELEAWLEDSHRLANQLDVDAEDDGGRSAAAVGTWDVISDSKACQQNGEGITRTSGGLGYTLASCKAECAGKAMCAAIDFFFSTGYCNTCVRAPLTTPPC